MVDRVRRAIARLLQDVPHVGQTFVDDGDDFWIAIDVEPLQTRGSARLGHDASIVHRGHLIASHVFFEQELVVVSVVHRPGPHDASSRFARGGEKKSRLPHRRRHARHFEPTPHMFHHVTGRRRVLRRGCVAVAHGEQTHAVFGVRREDETPVRTHAHGVRARRRRCGARGGADGRTPARRTLTRRTARLVQRTRAHARRLVDVDAKHQRVHRRAARSLHDDDQVLSRVRTAHGVRKHDANGRTTVESSRHGAHVRHRRVLRGRRRRAFARLRGGDEIVIIQPQTRPDAESQHPSRAFRDAIARIDALVRAHRHRRLLDPPAFPLRIRPARLALARHAQRLQRRQRLIVSIEHRGYRTPSPIVRVDAIVAPIVASRREIVALRNRRF